MARFLLLGKDNPGNPSAQHEIGMIVDVFPDSHVFGRREDKREWEAAGSPDPPWDNFFLVVDVPGLPVERVREKALRAWVRPAVSGDPEFDPVRDPADREVKLNRRQFRARLSQLNGGQRNQLFRDGFITLNLNRQQLNSVFVNRDPESVEEFDEG